MALGFDSITGMPILLTAIL